MDMMQLRKMVMAQMASGAKYESGEFTCGGGYLYITYGKTFDRYMLFIELTDESKQQLIESGINRNMTYAIYAIHPNLTIGELTETNNAWVSRYNPTTKAVNTTYSSMNTTSTGFSRTVGTGTTDLLNGYSYRYYVAEIKD